MANTRVGSSSVFAHLPFDQIDSPASISIHEDFLDAALTTTFATTTGVVLTNVGANGWWGAEVGSGDADGELQLVTAVADHPGIIRILTGDTSAATGDAVGIQFGRAAANDQDMYLPDDNGMYIATVLRIPDVDAQVVEFGFAGQVPEVGNASAVDIAGLVWDPTDSANVGDEMFLAQLNDNSSDTEIAMSSAKYVQNDWVLLEVALDDQGASFRVTTEDGSQSVQIAGTITVTMRPGYTVENVGANEEFIDIDLFHLRYLRRDALIGTASDWLGQ